MNDLGSAAVPAVGEDDHVRGKGPQVVLYIDLLCPLCAIEWAEIHDLPLELCVRHFPLKSKRPRSPALHAATEAVALQGGEEAFWKMLGLAARRPRPRRRPASVAAGGRSRLDLDRFEVDRRSDRVAARVEHATSRAGSGPGWSERPPPS